MCWPSDGTSPIDGSTPSMTTGGIRARSGPAGESDIPPAIARRELRVVRGTRRPSSCARRRCRPIRAARRPRPRSTCAKSRFDGGVQRARCSTRRRWCESASSSISSGRSSTSRAEARPLARVLDAEKTLAAVAGAERAVRCDRGVAGAAARRAACPVAGVVGRRAHPFAERVEQRNVQRRAVPGRRARQQGGENTGVARTSRRRYRRPRCRPSPARPGVPVIDSRPDLALHQQVVGLLRRRTARTTRSRRRCRRPDADAARAASAARRRAVPRRRARGSARRRRRSRAAGRGRSRAAGA